MNQLSSSYPTLHKKFILSLRNGAEKFINEMQKEKIKQLVNSDQRLIEIENCLINMVDITSIIPLSDATISSKLLKEREIKRICDYGRCVNEKCHCDIDYTVAKILVDEGYIRFDESNNRFLLKEKNLQERLNELYNQEKLKAQEKKEIPNGIDIESKGGKIVDSVVDNHTYQTYRTIYGYSEMPQTD